MEIYIVFKDEDLNDIHEIKIENVPDNISEQQLKLIVEAFSNIVPEYDHIVVVTEGSKYYSDVFVYDNSQLEFALQQ